MSLTPGTKIGQYVIVSALGAGSMGEVYRARDLRLDRDVAIKVLPQLLSGDPQRHRRFEVEARAAAALNHPNILAVYEMGTYDGFPYMVSELLEGKTLSETLRRGPLPLHKAIEFGIQITHGLAAAHDKGIVHRDLKPDNLFVTKDGRVKILDFGLAKVLPPKEQHATLAPTVTLPGIAMGTVGYMSPEQVRGQATDHRTDIFAFGAILYEMVMGKRSFYKPTEADTISAILNEEPPSISKFAPDTPLALERLIKRCLEKNPEQRFHSASDLAFALEALSDPSIAIRTGAHEIPKTEGSRWRPHRLTIALFLVLLFVIALYFLLKPAPVPAVVNYVQLTHDGLPKSLIGTDGARLYLGLGVGTSGNFSSSGIAEMSTAGGEPRKIASLSSSAMLPVDLSSDGSELLVVDGQGAPPQGPLRSFPILNGSPRRIGEIVAEVAAWSPDGKMLAFTRLGELYMASADGSNSHQLFSVRGDIRHIAWSPDSRHLRFDSSGSSGTSEGQFVWEGAADGTNLRRLLTGSRSFDDECCGKWTADGKFFVFQSNGQIWALPPKSFLHSEPAPVQLTSSPMTLSSPIPSKDGRKLFVLGRTFRGELMRFDSKTKQFASFLGGISAEYVAFSKDGQWVTYVSFREGTLWRSRIDGSDRLQLTYPPMYPVLPRWSPDGKNILFFEFALSSDKPARMYEVSSEGGIPRPVLPNDPKQQLDPNWSPDGSKIVFAGESNDPTSAIRILDLATRQLSNVPGSQGLFSPRWSPDGRYITGFSADSKKLVLFDFHTQKWTDLASDSFGWLNWSHDSRYVYLLQFGGKNAVVRIRISDHKMEQVADIKNFASTGRYGGCLTLAPDDSPLMLRDTGTEDVYSLDWQAQ